MQASQKACPDYNLYLRAAKIYVQTINHWTAKCGGTLLRAQDGDIAAICLSRYCLLTHAVGLPCKSKPFGVLLLLFCFSIADSYILGENHFVSSELSEDAIFHSPVLALIANRVSMRSEVVLLLGRCFLQFDMLLCDKPEML